MSCLSPQFKSNNFELADDHPSVDRNGRTARAHFYWLMLRKGFWLFGFISISEILVNAPIKDAWSYLLMNRAIKHPDSRFTTGGHQMSHQVAFGTARSDFMKPEKLGFLEGKKSGRTPSFYPAQDLSEKLSGL
jgi:Fic family protein